MKNATAAVGGEHDGETSKHQAAPAKWAALVEDTLVPLPRRRLEARDILAQAGVPPDLILVRDYDDRHDADFAPDAMIDLGEGNVFRLVSKCDVSDHHHPTAAPKLAFVVDDAWEVTIAPRQTCESLHGLFNLANDVELLRDLESPHDERIRPEEHVFFADGPVFRTRKVGVTVKVNTKPVHFTKRRVTGLAIKEAAIAQGVQIEMDFVLYPVKPDGGLGAAIDDTKHVHLHRCEAFSCIAADDGS